jgi:hypothetical protein
MPQNHRAQEWRPYSSQIQRATLSRYKVGVFQIQLNRELVFLYNMITESEIISNQINLGRVGFF